MMSTQVKPLTDWIGSQEVREETISGAVAESVAAVLDMDGERFGEGDPLPPLWHWFHFLPKAPMSRIDIDGHPKRGGFFPPVKQPRRMFAGARMKFLQPLIIGKQAVREGEILSVTEKSGKSGNLVFVTARYRIRQNNELCVEEEQDIVYKDDGPPVPAPVPLAALPDPGANVWVKDVTPSTVLLFRFSAITFNAHRIHYDRPYAMKEEGYPGLVVHGPLTALLLLEMTRARSGKRIAGFTFQGRAPLFDLHPFRLVGRPDGNKVELEAIGPNGKTAMSAAAELA